MLCPSCVAKAAKIWMLRKQILILRLEIQRLRQVIRQLKRIISNARKAGHQLIDEAERRMNQGGLPRAAWSYLKGIIKAAEAVLSHLE